MVTGQALDRDGKPVEGATLTLTLQSDNNKDKPVQYREVTDASGEFQFDGVREGHYILICEKSGYAGQKKSVNVKKNWPKNIVFLLSAGNSAETSGKMVHLEQVDPKTARVFVAVSSTLTPLQTKDPMQLPDPSKLPDFPFSSQEDMAAIVYGNGSPLDLGRPADIGRPALAGAQNDLLSQLNPNSVSLLDMSTQKIVASIPVNSAPTWIAFAPDGGRFWVVDQMHNLSMYSPNGDLLGSVNVGDSIVTDLAVSGSGDRVYLALRSWPESEIFVVDGYSNALQGHISLPANRGQPGGIAVSRDGRTLAVSMGTSTKGWIVVVDPASGSVVKEIEVGSQPLGIGITPDGSRAVVANFSSGTVDVVDLVGGTVISQIPTGMQPARVAMRSDGRVAFVSNNGDNSLSVINVETGAHIGKIPVGKGPMGVAITPDGKRVYVANHDSANVSIVDGLTLAVLGNTPALNASQVYGVAVRP